MLSELDILKDVCSRLERAGIDYMLTGSMAMNYYAQPHMTRDLLTSEVDAAYLRQWASALDVSERLEDCLRERHEP